MQIKNNNKNINKERNIAEILDHQCYVSEFLSLTWILSPETIEPSCYKYDIIGDELLLNFGAKFQR